ncbi:MAG TPA: pirin family protein [Steroidobacteraceae bacterium]|nr:pirin family protein [Steroidobacteraceae bacterium]
MTSERLPSHRAIVGDSFEIRRALPNRHRRTVGAWCFLDHAGPADYPAGQGLNIGPHPHIGLQTFSWMIEGRILHRDSLGYEQWIRPGQVNLMTAGRGISHAEESPADEPGRFQLAQLWIALPRAESEREPAFEHYPELPIVERGGFRVTVLAGTFWGERSPARVYSPLIGVDLATPGPARVEFPLEPAFEYAAVTLEGRPEVDGAALDSGILFYLGKGRDTLAVASEEFARILLIGGEPFGEDIILWWNFVARTTAEMETATRDWNEGRRFGAVRGARSAPLVAPDFGGLRLLAGRP